MSLAEEWTESEPTRTDVEGNEVWAGGPDLARRQLLNDLVFDAAPPEAITAAKQLFSGRFSVAHVDLDEASLG